MYKSTLKKNLRILSILLLVSINTIAQTENNPNTFLPNIIPPSPSAYQLGNYGNVPVGMFTGSPNVNIPIYNYKTTNIEVPITMFYSNNGIKVDDISSNVGQGWNLNFGGVITRIIRDLPDEERLKPFVALPTNATLDERITFFKYIGEEELTDSEADLFSFNFGNYSGKFIFNHDGTIMLMPAQNIKIEKIVGQEYFTFIATTPDGIKYYFDQIEYSKIFKEAGGNPLTKTSISSWYLSKIVHPKGDEIYFTYRDKTDNFISAKSQTLSVQYPKIQRGCSSTAITGFPILSPIKEHRMSIIGKEIQSINSNNVNNGEIIFDYFESNSGDVELGNKKIKEITITTNNKAKKIDKAQFSYTTTSNKRVFLDKIQFNDLGKNYQFEYLNREKFPPRLSLSQDHWGYYNGKVNTQIVPNKTESDLDYIDYGGADKEPNGDFAPIGMLTKIIYPTKGSTMFEYEANDYYGDKVITPPLKKETLFIDRTGPIIKEITITTQNAQEIALSGAINFDDECQLDDLGKTKATIRVKNLATSDYVNLSKRTGNGDLTSIGNSVDLKRGEVNDFILLANPNQTYTISLSLAGSSTQSMYRPCTSAGLDFAYLPSAPVVIKTNLISGGVRIKSTTDNASGTSLPVYKRYFYASKNDVTKSSGILGSPSIYLDISKVFVPCSATGDGGLNLVGYIRGFINITSSSLTSLFDNGNSCISYQYVTISYGDNNFANGGEMNEFYIYRTSNNQISGDLRIYSAPKDYGVLTNGILLKNIIFNNKKDNVQVTTNLYDNIQQKESKSYNVRKYFQLTDGIEGGPQNINTSNLGIVEYLNSSYWNYLKSKENIIYDVNGLNPITTTTEYVYKNPAHLQLSVQRTKSSTGDNLETKYYYPQDQEMTAEPMRTELIAKNMVAIPLKTESYRGVEKLSQQITQYAAFPSSVAGQSLLLPKFILGKKGDGILSDLSDRKITFDAYDTFGNIIQYTPEKGNPVTIIWGYNKTLPIAKIENATYSQVSGSVLNLQNLSDTGTETNLLLALATLRSSLPNAMVTTYTYLPLIGISTITDPKGMTTTYLYDSFSRLQVVKDNAGKIISENLYHYKN